VERLVAQAAKKAACCDCCDVAWPRSGRPAVGCHRSWAYQ
jgi:hypothetical protein